MRRRFAIEAEQRERTFHWDVGGTQNWWAVRAPRLTMFNRDLFTNMMIELFTKAEAPQTWVFA